MSSKATITLDYYLLLVQFNILDAYDYSTILPYLLARIQETMGFIHEADEYGGPRDTSDN